MQVLLTAVAFQSFGVLLTRTGVDWLLMSEDGTLCDPHGASIAREDAHPDIAWGTSDLFREEAPLVPFFTAMLESVGLGWFQSPGAGYEDPVFGALVANGVRVTNAHVNSVPIAEFVIRSVSTSSKTQRSGATRHWGAAGRSTTGARSRAPPGSLSGWEGSEPRSLTERESSVHG